MITELNNSCNLGMQFSWLQLRDLDKRGILMISFLISRDTHLAT